ncbi:ribonuclease P/MRP protein subunit POP5 isoform X2 [Numida meleagris]|uniref:ribonuclease P/MRP protein subunit POP5 isoform X2 n=1 Tax=Numida meleagris TaxID=8996 RepID=UPI000B3DF087|nr:ribonuclease P/MRP protein subunit POP5 isoform X2 [Numida meleagris]
MVRFKNRYVLCEVLSEDPRCRQCIEDRAVGLAVKDAIARAHGDYGLGCCCVSFTGTIRTCQKFLIRYNRRQLLLLLQKCTNEEERRSVRQSVLSCSLEEEQAQSGEEEEEDEDGTETD